MHRITRIIINIFIAFSMVVLLSEGVRAQHEPTTDHDASMTTAAANGEGELQPEYLYNGMNRPVRLTIHAPHSLGTLTLALMDANGAALAEPVSVQPGVIELGEMLPAIWSLRRTAYLQMIEEGLPIGSALVLQPLLSRLVPVTEIAPHPVSGRPHTKIVGWVDENALPPPVMPNTATTSSAPTVPAAPASAIDRTFSGLRVYPERDVVLHTTHGDIRIALKPDEAPNTVWNFLELCRGGFYRDVPFHRIVPLTPDGHPFVIQAGDPSTLPTGPSTGSPTGDGGPGYWLPIENSSLSHDFGVISMARADDPDSNGSQFFFCLSREGTARLDGQYCSFGYAVEGAATILSIALVPLADIKAGRAADPPVITTAELVPAPPRTPGMGRPDARVMFDSAAATPSAPRRPSGHIPR